jgi:hypothetical protein
MKIEDFIRDTLVKTDLATKGKVDVEGLTATDAAAGLLESLPDADFAFPDLLQAFGKLLARRQLLMDELPAAVKARLPETSGFSAENNKGTTEMATAGKASFQQGLSGLVRDNRMATESLKQMVAELEFIERVPGLEKVFATLGRNLINNQSQTVDSGQLIPQSPSQQGTQTARAMVASPQPASFEQLVENSLATMQTVMTNAKSSLGQPDFFHKLTDQSLQQGKLSPVFSAWITDVATLLEQLADDPKLAAMVDKLTSQVEPKVVQLAQMTGRPEIVKVWAVVQEWGNLSQQNTDSPVLNNAKLSTTLEMLKSIVPQLADQSMGLQLPNPANVNSLPSYGMRLEMLYSLVANRPELLDQVIKLLPELLGEMDPSMASLRSDEKTGALIYETLARSAPQWLKAMAEREAKPALLQLWVATKMADFSPWIKMEPSERQQLAGTLKELTTSFEQPEPFRMPREDSSSRSFMMQTPLFAPGQEKPYPALIQVFEEKKERGNRQPTEQEIWVRVTLETDNIGTVDLSFRLQDKKYLSIFSRFADPEAASAFRSSLAEIRREFADSSLELKKIAVAGRINTGGNSDG